MIVLLKQLYCDCGKPKSLSCHELKCMNVKKKKGEYRACRNAECDLGHGDEICFQWTYPHYSSRLIIKVHDLPCKRRSRDWSSSCTFLQMPLLKVLIEY